MTSGLRGRATVWLGRSAVPRLLWWSRRLLPAGHVVVVAGFPPSEGNAVETVRALRRRYSGRVVWVDGPPPGHPARDDTAGVTVVPRYSRAALTAYARAEAVFFTHGLYGAPRTVPGRPTVNLWHGSGMKAMGGSLLPDRRATGPMADLLVSGARVWGEYYARLMDLDPAHVVYSGNPRIDAFGRPVPAEGLTRLGLDPAAPFVLWMPTFRRSAGTGLAPGWSDSGPTAEADLATAAARLSDGLAARGVRLVVKPHPLDATLGSVPGALVVTDADVADAGLELYELLGSAAGLVTDVSSVWTDFLVLDRPIAFLFPDRDAYLERRGVHPADVHEHLPGRELVDSGDVDRFAEEVLGDASSADLRAACAEWIGLARPAGSAADAMLDHLASGGTSFARRLRRG